MSKNFLFKITILLTIIFSISYWMYINYIREDGEIITVYADETPTKVKPQERGGIIIANSNNVIYENLQKKKVGKEAVLQPEPEKPLNILSPKARENNQIHSIEDIISTIERLEGPHNKNNHKDKEEDLEILYQNLISEKGITSPASEVKVNEVASGAASLNIIKVKERRTDFNEKQLLSKIKKKYYQIQLASVKTEIVATQEMERIKKKYAKIFNKIPLTVRKMRSEKGNFFYSVTAGNYENIGQAKAICKKLDSYQECLITNY